MDKPTILICSHHDEWIVQIRQALGGDYQINEKCGDLSQDDLTGDDIHLAPDVVVWRFDGPQPMRKLAYLEKMRWGLGTKFVLVRHRPWRIPWLYTAVHDTNSLLDVFRFWLGRFTGKQHLPAPLLPPGTSVNDVVNHVKRSVNTCWWTLLAGLDLPACQISPGGRILRANRAMTETFRKEVTGTYFRASVEDATCAGDYVFPPFHPILRAIDEGRACQDFIECEKGQFQLVCIPEEVHLGSDAAAEASPSRTVSVLIPDSGRRSRIFNFAKTPSTMSSIQDVYQFIVGCAKSLGYERVRLYEWEESTNEFRGVASFGFRDPENQRRFDEGFRIPVAEDLPSLDTINNGIPVLCVVDPSGDHRGLPRELVRYYDAPRNYVVPLELEGVNRWIDAPLIVPAQADDDGRAVLGKLVVDRGKDSDKKLSIRDALDVGLLALMAAGAIHAFRETAHEQRLKRKQRFLNELLEVLPEFAFERNNLRFYRAIAAILSCDAGLRWEQVLLFIVDSSGLRQAACEMALGGRGEPDDHRLRMLLESRRWTLREYVEDALNDPEPKEDTLYRDWVKTKEPRRTISFSPPVIAAGHNPVAKLLASPRQRDPYLKLDVATEVWCQEMNKEVSKTFSGSHVFAFPLTNAFALDVDLFTPESRRTQPVGVALLGVASRPDDPKELDLELTRVTLDLLGALIAQRWTAQRAWGVVGAMNTLHGTTLKNSWDNLYAHVRKLLSELDVRSENSAFDMARKELLDDTRQAVSVLDELVNRVQLEKVTLKNLSSPGLEALDFAEFLAENRQRWIDEWDKNPAGARLSLDAPEPSSPVTVPCSRLVLADVMSCLIENAVQVATHRARETVNLRIRAREYANPQNGSSVEGTIPANRAFVEITVEDDAGGVRPEDEAHLFLKGFTKRSGGTGLGLALARAEMFMFSGDLRYIRDTSGQTTGRGAKFQLVFFKPEGTNNGSQRSAGAQKANRAHRGQHA